MSTLRQRLKEAKELLSKTYDTTITYVVVCKPTDTYENAIEIFDTIEEARECIKGINEQFVLDGGTRTKLYILPIVVCKDSYEEVTEENMQYDDTTSEWVKNFKEEMQSLYY